VAHRRSEINGCGFRFGYSPKPPVFASRSEGGFLHSSSDHGLTCHIAKPARNSVARVIKTVPGMLPTNEYDGACPVIECD